MLQERQNYQTEITCQQVLVKDFSVYSVQRVVLPLSPAGPVTPAMVMERYLEYIRKVTLSIVSPVTGAGSVEFLLFGRGPSLLGFLAPVFDHDRVSLRIRDGVLALKTYSRQGELRFLVEDVQEGIRISLQLQGYYPLLLGQGPPSAARLWFYRHSQSAIHRLVTVRFLTLLCRELLGSSAPIRVRPVKELDGLPL